MITKNKIEEYKTWFNQYVNQFLHKYPTLEENIKIKAEHCRKVSIEMKELAFNLNLADDEIMLAETIGLFHDVGRFKQYVKYQTFADSKSQNHAQLGVEVLKENHIFDDIEESTQQLIYKSIYNHSRLNIEEDKNEKIIFFSKLIRDSDKLDIWRLITEYYLLKERKKNDSLELELPNKNTITDDVLQAVLKKQMVAKESLKTLNDFKILQIAWLFDLNFSYSVKKVHEKKYLDKILKTLPVGNEVEQIKDVVNKYFNKHLENTVIHK